MEMYFWKVEVETRKKVGGARNGTFLGFLNLFVHGSGNKFFQNKKLLWKWGLFVLHEY